MKLCKDCKWASKGGWFVWGEFAKCSHPLGNAPDFVRGDKPSSYCDMERKWGKCGRDAALFEQRGQQPPKRSIFQRLFA